MSLTIKKDRDRFTAMWRDLNNNEYAIVTPVAPDELIRELVRAGVPMRDIYDEIDRVDPLSDAASVALQREIDARFKALADGGIFLRPNGDEREE